MPGFGSGAIDRLHSTLIYNKVYIRGRRGPSFGIADPAPPNEDTYGQDLLAMESAETGRMPLLQRSWSPYVVPFGIFALLTYALPFAGLPSGIAYGIKVLVTCVALIFYWNQVREEFRVTHIGLSLLSGILVYGLWVLLEGLYPSIGTSNFDPHREAEGAAWAVLIATRLAGSVLVVPLMEELFWRSFALRVFMDADFKRIPLGRFSWSSFLLVSAAFGFEHHQWLPGILAGMVYAGVLYRTGNLFVPTLSHAVTNLILGIHVIVTGQWFYW
jgi:CAAX prenyl protease-like protein